MSYDNTGQLGANTWRHVAFIEQTRTVDLPMPGVGLPGARQETPTPRSTWEPRQPGQGAVERAQREALAEFDPQTGHSGTGRSGG